MKVNYLPTEEIASAVNVLLSLHAVDQSEQEIDVVEIFSGHFGLSLGFAFLIAMLLSFIANPQ